MVEVCLVSMPYAAIERPSIAIGILQACLQKAGIDVTTIYGNLLFAEAVGLHNYAIVECTNCEDLIGEWTFSGCAFPQFQPDHQAFFKLLGYKSETLQDALWELRTQSGPFINRLTSSLLEMQPRIVGCSSTFQQNCASLALLRRIKELAPNTITLMGGANCEGSMGVALSRMFPWVDFVISGEADELIVDLCQQLLEHKGKPHSQALPYGVIARTSSQSNQLVLSTQQTDAPRAVVKRLDDIPTPIYDDYFATLRNSTLKHEIFPGLPVETSRGCWWGQKHHCTFCGLNGLGMGYRSKSFNRVMLELAALADHHKLRKFEIVDNILDMSYFETVLLQLTTLNDKYVLFFETKANLKRAHIRRLAEAGVTWIQPGIESLQDNFLKLINKGTTALINVQLMKWCREYGIRLSWSILSGAPGEHDEWYTEMASWLPLVVHLQPPNGLMGIRYDRFSPYFIHPDTYGISLVPCRSYAFVYPVSQAALYELAYFFEDCKDLDATQIHPYEQRVQLMQPGLDQVRAQVEEWVRLFWEGLPPILSMTDNGTSLRILDTRPCAMNRFHHLKGLARDIYLACDEATAALALINALSKVCYPEVLWGDIAPVIDQLKQNKLLLELNDKFLSLAVQGSVPTLPPLKNFPGGCFNLSKQADAQSIAKS